MNPHAALTWVPSMKSTASSTSLAEEGKAVIVISSEMPELLGISDRIYVMNDGKFVAEMPAKEATQEKIMRAIMKSWER